jgi:hypothetical protein
VSPPTTVTAPPITRLNRRYALTLAELILRHASVTTEHGTTRSISFVFDMNRVFEDFVSIALTEALRAHGVAVRLQHTGCHLDQERLIPLRPGITLWRDGRCVGVVDAKYKRLTDERFPLLAAQRSAFETVDVEAEPDKLLAQLDAVAAALIPVPHASLEQMSRPEDGW